MVKFNPKHITKCILIERTILFSFTDSPIHQSIDSLIHLFDAIRFWWPSIHPQSQHNPNYSIFYQYLYVFICAFSIYLSLYVIAPLFVCVVVVSFPISAVQFDGLVGYLAVFITIFRYFLLVI